MAPSTSGKNWRVLAILLLTMAGFYWKLTLTRQYTWTNGPDLAEQVLPWFQFQATEWRAGRIPLWDPYVWAGHSLIGQAQPGVVYPLNWLLFAMPLGPDGKVSQAALNWYYVIIHFMAAAFAFLFCRDQGRSRGASFAGGVIFALSGFLGTTAWPQMMNGAVWIPLVFLFQFRALRGERPAGNAALSGLFLGISFLSGHHQVPMFTTVAWALVWLWHLARDRRLIRAAALALIVMLLAGAAQTLPSYEYGKLARRWVGAPEALEWNQTVPYSVHEQFDLRPGTLFGLVFPQMKTNFGPFVGVVALTLALLALAACWRERGVALLAMLALGAVVYALGHNSVFQGLLYALVPDLDKARTTTAVVAVMQFAVAALAAFGLDRLHGDKPLPWLRATRWILVAFAAIVLTVSLHLILANSSQSYPGDDHGILSAVIALILAALLMRPDLGKAPLLLLLVFELGDCPMYNLIEYSDRNAMQWMDKLYANRDIADFLRQQPGFARVEIADDLFASNWGSWNGVQTNGGMGASVPSNLLDSEYFGRNGKLMWSVAYVIAKQPKAEFGDEVFTGTSGLKVYRRSNSFPRAWSVHELEPVKSRVETRTKIGQDFAAFRGRRATIEAPPPATETCDAPDHVWMIEHLPNRLAVRADMACGGMVVVNDAFFPGWLARVDHVPAPIYEVNGAMRGVMVPKGSHTVTMHYRPVSVYLGVGLTLAGVLLALAARWGRTAAMMLFRHR